MRLIYKHAAITLVASIASAASEGFLHHVEDPHYLLNPISVPYQVHTSDMSPPEITLSWPARYMGLSDPINGRAWTFQEFLLSSRAIVFSYGGISMIDRSDTTSKNGFTAGKSSGLNELPWNDLLLSLDRMDNPRDAWLKIRGEYSSRRLSYALDKLPAFSAVAEEFGRANGWDYCAGLWRHELLDDLQWSSLSYEDVSSNEVTRTPRPQQYVAPSWSWASVDARITASVFPTPEAAHKSHRVFKRYLDFEIISCQAQLTSANYLYGPVGSGMLIAKGRICLMIWEPYSEHRWQTVASIQGREEDGSLLSLSDEVGRQGGAIVDAFDAALRAGVTVTCLATRVVEEKLDGRDRIEGLMLLPVGIGANTYRRVGFFRMDELLPFEQVRAEVISII